jgi:hypothetical protein
MSAEIERYAALIEPLRASARSEDPAWNGTPFDWVRRLPSPRRRGAIGEALLAAILVEAGVTIERSPDPESDRLVGGIASEIKCAFRCERGRYTFMQIRPTHAFERLLLLGISPDRLDLYDLPRDVAIAAARRQHLGASGSGETLLLAFPADTPPASFAEYGGELSTGIARIVERCDPVSAARRDDGRSAS